jgi:hypothetical protein
MAWVAGISFILWGCSGLLHPVMSWTNPRPAHMSPPAPQIIPALPDVKPDRDLSSLRILREDGKTLLQITNPDQGERVYKDAATGGIIEGLDQKRAVRLARYYAGEETAAIRSVALITHFDRHYPAINQYLPVWEIAFDRPDHLSVFVDTGQDRLGAMNTRLKKALMFLFSNIHTFAFLDNLEGLRLGLIGFCVLSILMAGGMGLAVLITVRRPGKRRGWRGLHRWIGVAAWIPLMIMPMSGLFHLVMQSPLVMHEKPAAGIISAAGILYDPPALENMTDARLIQPPRGNTPFWRVENPKTVLYRNAVNGKDIAGDENFIRLLTGTEKPVIKIATFSNEYGFANKRLPVYRVEDGKGGLAFIEARSGITAAQASSAAMIENGVFSTFHKWNFLEPLIGRAWRDILMAAFILLGLCMAAGGIAIRSFRKI